MDESTLKLLCSMSTTLQIHPPPEWISTEGFLTWHDFQSFCMYTLHVYNRFERSISGLSISFLHRSRLWPDILVVLESSASGKGPPASRSWSVLASGLQLGGSAPQYGRQLKDTQEILPHTHCTSSNQQPMPDEEGFRQPSVFEQLKGAKEGLFLTAPHGSQEAWRIVYRHKGVIA